MGRFTFSISKGKPYTDTWAVSWAESEKPEIIQVSPLCESGRFGGGISDQLCVFTFPFALIGKPGDFESDSVGESTVLYSVIFELVLM